MKVCAVICELNPFHNGHEHIFREAKIATGADFIIALMSGNFVQRAEPAIMNEYSRAEVALKLGADMVLELPTVYSVASADKFAQGSIDIINSLPFVTHIALGVESKGELITEIAQIQANEPEIFKARLRDNLDNGLPYPKAVTVACADVLSNKGFDKDAVISVLQKPNNKLAVAYKKAMIKSGSNFVFTPILRMEIEGRYQSASVLRQRWITDGLSVRDFIPDISYKALLDEKGYAVNWDKYDALMLFALRSATLAEISQTPDCAEGIEHKIKELAGKSASFGEFLAVFPTSRFTKSRVMRICLQTLLKINKEMQNSYYINSRLLGVRKEAFELMKELPENIITNKNSETNILKKHLNVFDVDRRSSELYALLCGKKENMFYRKLAVIN
ncbi:MAG: nucleotidyltransferase family protein [Clostridia bacterium]|nr:nucleotidyltransferase family protein [Clostridia bacterium]